MKPILALGAMSGTSMDGIDLALIRSDGERAVEIGPGAFFPYEADFRARIEAGLAEARDIEERAQRPGSLAALEADITDRHADAVKRFLSDLPAGWSDVGLVGFHGQTVLHRPQSGLTVQLGDGRRLADAVGLPVAYDTRANDMVHGGQGAPLAPAWHAALAASLPAGLRGGWPVVFVNIGGISNITFVPETGDPVAFDTGPGNGLIDQWVARKGGVPFDEGGAIASGGAFVYAVADRYLTASFFDRPGPKSLDRGDFTLEHVEGLNLADGARTLAGVTARAILKAVEHLPATPALWIVCGGGRKNDVVMADMKRLAGAPVVTAEEAGLDGDAIEAQAWAYLAIRSRYGLPLTFPTTTGCRQPVSGGVTALPAA